MVRLSARRRETRCDHLGERPRLRRAHRCVRRGRPRDGGVRSRQSRLDVGGGPLVCAASLATLQAIEEGGLLDKSTQTGEWIRAQLRERLVGVAGVKEIRGRGMMMGIELDRPCGDIVRRAREQGLLVNVTAENVVRLLPPLIFSMAEAEQLVGTLAPIIKDFLAAKPS